MSEISSMHIIQSLQRKWNLQLRVAYLVLVAAVAILLSVIMFKAVGVNWIVLLLLFIVSSAVIYFLFIEMISEQDVVRFLNGTFPELQESAHLLLQPFNTLNALEKLQVKRVEHTLTENIPAPLLIRKKFKTSIFILTTVLLFTIILLLVPYQQTYSSSATNISN